MAKLYWRVKRDGKWTWQAAIVVDRGCCEYEKVMPSNVLIPEKEE